MGFGDAPPMDLARNRDFIGFVIRTEPRNLAGLRHVSLTFARIQIKKEISLAPYTSELFRKQTQKGNPLCTLIGLVVAAGCSHRPGQQNASCTPTASGVTCTLPPTTTGYTLTTEGAGGTPPVTGVPAGVNDDLQGLINANPEGTQFIGKAGVHRQTKRRRRTDRNSQANRARS